MQPVQRTTTHLLDLARRIYKKKNLYGVFKAAYAKLVPPETTASLYRWSLTVDGIHLTSAAYDILLSTLIGPLRAALGR